MENSSGKTEMMGNVRGRRSNAQARQLQRLAQHADVANLVGQQQDQSGVERLALFIAQVAVGVDQGFVKIVAGRKLTKVTLTGLAQIWLQLQGHGRCSQVCGEVGLQRVRAAQAWPVARATAARTRLASKLRQRAATCWSGRAR